ncbi:flavodoxin family protein [Pelotomaculum terephthalicicum JT]|uniref:flavodoxin family protein n=1 Tax=Pelotomaculum TaxID=191373 RepID=UPI0009C66CF8|nr:MULTISPECIES: flavodoxin family protein [Pelotomaculum]MCG9969397.1 flavodoxin family protein [Pelotomaculum terephthalicicum JT]OPX87828.1 MAG: 2-amino-4-deoxychorismate dehydrogenase [Pelotomaculum sp. PtaB.Bin117]OPY63092.1 MAG: 2-amino-4-deoxychorismate dehydrogenase [Pelotomaculum sp. PtaU1.Bin065]
MKVVGISGSARKDGNTAIMIKRVFEELEKEGIETELIQLAGKKIRGCLACMKCQENQDKRCSVDDDFNMCFEKMLQADGIILGSPTYFSDMTPEMKALIDRAGYVARANGDLLKRKAGAAVSVARRAGAIHTVDSMNHLFFISQMIVPGSNYWNLGIGREKGEVGADAEGMQTMRVLGENMAWLLKKIKG